MPRKGQKSGVYTKCENCGKIIYKTKTEYNKSKHHYCCYECSIEGHHNLNSEDRECEFCGKIFNTTKGDPKRFCSIGCQHEWQKTNVGAKNPKFGGKTIPCDWCGELFDIHKYNLEKYEHHFCCVECRRAWHANVLLQSDEWKESSRERILKELAEMKLNTNTKPQRIINSILDEMQIKYENEKQFKYYSVDNYLPEYNLVIEVMGDFWHCNPQKYPDGEIHEIQKKRIPKDQAKRTYLKRWKEIEVLYLWEYDIYNNLDVCIELVKAYIQADGKLTNYNSFNYHLNGGALELNDEMIVPYFETKIA